MALPDDFEVLDVGYGGVFQNLFPKRTTHVFASHSSGLLKKNPGRTLTLRMALDIWRDLVHGHYKLVMLEAARKCLWNPHRSAFQNLTSVARHLLAPSSFAPYLILWAATYSKVPIIAYDMADTMLISSESLFLFPFVRCYFKRELPQNKWHVFLSVTAKCGDVSNIRRQRFFQEALVKVRPFPLQIDSKPYLFSKVSAAQKQVDVFYAGDNLKTTVRTDGMPLLAKMREMGLNVDVSETRLDYDEFCRRISRAWLVWSPEGSGWDCHRHYESLINGAVPVINYPTICRYKPMIDGVHALYYGCEEDDLIRVISKALADKKRLLKIISAGRAHLQEWYSITSLGTYVLKECGLE